MGDEEKHRPRINKYVLSIGFIALCATALVVYLFYTGDIAYLPQAFHWPQALWLLLAFALTVATWFIESGVLFLMARGLVRPIPFSTSFKSTMVVQFFNNITPFASGGQPMQIWRLWRDGIPVGESTSIQVGKFIVYQAVLTFCSLVSLFYVIPLFQETTNLVVVLIVIAFIVQVIVLLFVLLLILKPRFMRWIMKLVEKLAMHTPLKNKLQSLFEKLDVELARYEITSTSLVGHPRVFIEAALLTLLQLLAFFSVPFCVCHALGVDPPLVESMAAAAFVLMVGGVVPLPGGTGGAEGMFALAFLAFFPQGASVAVAVFLWRLFTFYLPILVGSPFCLGATKGSSDLPS